MFELSEEETLMNSPDGSVRLTTYRIIYDFEKGRRQMMLEDVESCELKRGSVGSFGVALMVVFFLTLLLAINMISFYTDKREIFRRNPISLWELLQFSGILYSLVLLLVLYFFYRISRRYFIRINGKYDSIDIRVTGFKHPSVRKMIHTLAEESARRKRVLHTTGPVPGQV